MDSAIARSSDGQCIPFANRALERLGHAAADALYLALTGGTLTGRLTIDRTGDHEALVINQHRRRLGSRNAQPPQSPRHTCASRRDPLSVAGAVQGVESEFGTREGADHLDQRRGSRQRAAG